MNPCYPFYYSKRTNTIRPNCLFNAQFLLGSRYLDSRKNILFYDPNQGNLLVGRDNTVDATTTNSAVIGSAGIHLVDCANTVVAGVDFSSLVGSSIRDFRNTFVGNEVVAVTKFRVGSLIDQGASVILPQSCGGPFWPNCAPYPPGDPYAVCECGEQKVVASDDAETSTPCTVSSQNLLDPIFTSYGDAHVKGSLAVDNMVYCGPITASGTVTGTVASFGRTTTGAINMNFLEVPRDAPLYDIANTTLITTFLAAPLSFPQELRLDTRLGAFLFGATFTFKDDSSDYPGQPSHNIVITCDFNNFMEVRTPTGQIIRKAGGGYVIDTVGGSVTFMYKIKLGATSGTWLIVAEVKGATRT